ncbi:hypothetical protein N7471_010755 [Penicillium samsonianum]|uniref:uncharacterized protein n=1 Tax=Penicillium samsonianum TaxID=1882272 RepID=UPI002547D1CB|nr:uncharacterized protein N7471_010755 [Penicillium samsonianum]KAJ6126262.1 hypothetical protein N7471_010755 [Penicillium samsonianum]
MVKKKGKISAFATTDPEPDPPTSDTQDKEDQETILALITSDLTIICKGEAFSAHKLVVCPRSKYFHRACYGGFKVKQETEGQIHLDERSPILIEKVLEFLYTGDYTLERLATTSMHPGTESAKRQEIHTGFENGLVLDSSSEACCMHNSTAEMERLVGRSSAEKKPAPIDEIPGKDPFEHGVALEPVGDILADFHPCYFHVRMYGEADYFMINDLKAKAKAHFLACFMDNPKRKPFADTIEELYSTQADYRQLRQLAIETIVDDLPNLRKGLFPVIDSRLMKAVPDFTYDLCQATLDKYVGVLPTTLFSVGPDSSFSWRE